MDGFLVYELITGFWDLFWTIAIDMQKDTDTENREDSN
jgi:hypothetical protein